MDLRTRQRPHYRPLTDKEWIKWRSQDPVYFNDRYELCEDGPAMYKKRISTSSPKNPAMRHTNWSLLTGKGTSAARNFDNSSNGTKPFEYFGRDIGRRKFFPARDERPGYTAPNISHKQSSEGSFPYHASRQANRARRRIS